MTVVKNCIQDEKGGRYQTYDVSNRKGSSSGVALVMSVHWFTTRLREREDEVRQ